MTLRRIALALAVASTVAPLGARAQTLVRPPGITVNGTGTVRRPADAVRYTIVLAIRSGSATGASVFSSADALVAALKRNGSADAAVADPLNAMVNQQSVVTVRGTIRKPTVEGVRALIAAVTASLPPDGVPIQQISYVNLLDDCTEPERTAEAAALADARARAAGIAAAAHVTLGSVTSVTEGFGQAPGCPTRPDATFPATGFNPGSASADAFSVTLTVPLTVSFAIGPAAN
jgi:uncharacterized protein YggE